MKELIGTIIDRKYRLTRVIGEGGMGSIFEAEHTRIERKVAVKVLHQQFSTSQELTQRFFREAQASSAIGHPNIIEIFDVGVQEDGTVFIVMELLEGKVLSDWMLTDAAADSGLCVAVILQVLSALIAAHDKGIIHRDLKPDNVFMAVDNRGRQEVKLLDFGIAKVQGELEGDQGLTKTGTVLGTPNYMSPEQARGKPVDHRIDIWAAGVMLYHMLSGKLPFSGQSYNEVLSGILLETPTPLKSLSKGVPAKLVTVVEKAMAKDRDDRYQNVTSMVEALMDFADMDSDVMTVSAASAIKESLAPPPYAGPTRMGRGTVPHKRRRTDKKRRGVGAVWLVLLFLLGTLTGLFFYFTDSDKPILERGSNLAEEAIAYWHNKDVDQDILDSLKSIGPIGINDVRPEDVKPDLKPDTSPDTSSSTNADTSSSVGKDGGTDESAEAENAPVEEELPAEVKIEFEGLRKRAKVYLDGKKVKPPLELKRSEKPVQIKVTLRKYKPFKKKIVPDKDQTVKVVLKKKSRGRRGRKN